MKRIASIGMIPKHFDGISGLAKFASEMYEAAGPKAREDLAHGFNIVILSCGMAQRAVQSIKSHTLYSIEDGELSELYRDEFEGIYYTMKTLRLNAAKMANEINTKPQPPFDDCLLELYLSILVPRAGRMAYERLIDWANEEELLNEPPVHAPETFWKTEGEES